jgi:DNA topoisomerase-3
VILIVAEKPYMARDIARALCLRAETDRLNHRFTGTLRDPPGGPLCVGYCNGHIIELAPPEAYDEKYAQWKLQDLPLIPDRFIYDIREPELFRSLEGMMQSAVEVVNACDAGREGEVIFREVVRYLGIERKLSITRMWILDTTDDGLRKAFRERQAFNKPKFERMAEAGFTRQRIDWLLGINCSRLATLCMPALPEGAVDGPSGRRTYSIGRVQTPVLNVIYERTRMVHLWKPALFYRIYAKFASPDGSLNAQVIAPEGFRYNNSDTQFNSAEAATSMLSAMRTGALTWETYETVNHVEELSPSPFSLVTLQRAANRIMGWPSSRTLRVAQALYAKYRAITYPRTESEHWPESMNGHIVGIWKRIWAGWAKPAYPGLKELPEPPEPSMRFFRDTKEDHYAITPTGTIPPDRDESGNVLEEYRLWRLIVARFLVSLLPNAKVDASVRIFNYREKLPEELQSKFGRKSEDILARYEAGIIREPNWLAYENVFGNTRGEGVPLATRLQEVFPPCPPTVQMTTSKIATKTTHAPEFLTEDTLLFYMVKGNLGTAATRADTIDTLHRMGYVSTNDQRFVRTTSVGEFLIKMLADGELKELVEPSSAAVWENLLDALEMGKKSLDGQTGADFVSLMRKKVIEYSQKFQNLVVSDELVFCPKSGHLVTVVTNHDEAGNPKGEGYFFPGYLKPGENSPFPKIFNKRPMSAKDYRDILLGGRNGGPPLEFFSQKTNKNFYARLVYEIKKKHLKFNFAMRGHVHKKDTENAAANPPQASTP